VALNSECDIPVKPRTLVLAGAPLRAGNRPKKETAVAVTLLPALEKTLERRFKAEQAGEVRFDAFTRGRYATDASHYQIMPLGVVTPRSAADAEQVLAVCRSEGVAVTPRGGGTSQAGQTVNRSVILDCSQHFKRVIEIDAANRRCLVEPGIVLDELNRALKPYGLWFPVDISTASRATIGGMVGNNSCGARSLRYGNTRENVLSIDAVLADGTRAHFGRVGEPGVDVPPALVRDLLAIVAREANEIERRFPKVQRRVGGYNLDALVPGRNDVNLAHLLVGSEGTLAFSTRIELKLAPLLGPRAVGACHFGSFHEAMAAAQHIVALKPIAVELIDRTMLGLAREIAMFKPTVDAFLRGDPEAILFVEFAEDRDENARRLKALAALIGDLGLSWDKGGAKWGGVVGVLDPKLQAAIGEVRTAGLNIMMSMKEEGKPISFVEDCAVPLEHLADYTARLTEIFEKNGTRGTWYAHAAVGCLHVRPVLNLRLEKDVRAMRAIAEAAFAMVREYKGSHSGEHGDGIVRSEFHQTMFGPQLVHAFEEVKDRFDPGHLFNPGKIVRAPKFDARENFRYRPGYRAEPFAAALDWSAYSGAGGGFQGAVEMCNNNGACRALAGGVMCPSYRVTLDERDVTRGRANTLRLAITGQLGPKALTSEDMTGTLKLCVSCKACRRECPTGVDMARMKIEVLRARADEFGLSLHERLVGYLPRYAPYAARWPWLFNLRDRLPGAATLSEAIAQFAAERRLPKWRKDYFRDEKKLIASAGKRTRGEVVLFADTFNRYFEPENVRAAIAVLTAGGYQVHLAQPDNGGRPLCCGRTFLAIGKTDEAAREAERTLAALRPQLSRGLPVIGLEPSCVFGFRDEIPALLKSDTARQAASRTILLEEFLAAEAGAGKLEISFAPAKHRALLHGHCHQKSFGAMGAVETTLKLIPGLDVASIESSCCGMAGAFGYDAETIDASRAMGELSLLPAVRAAAEDAIIVADGTSCRQQIRDGTGREAVHVARVLAMALPPQ
jgi:FAD/FMN-containing dehydrogenase/Fe-S oxidoreductase